MPSAPDRLRGRRRPGHPARADAPSARRPARPAPWSWSTPRASPSRRSTVASTYDVDGRALPGSSATSRPLGHHEFGAVPTAAPLARPGPRARTTSHADRARSPAARPSRTSTRSASPAGRPAGAAAGADRARARPKGSRAPGLIRATLGRPRRCCRRADVVAVPLASRGDAEADHALRAAGRRGVRPAVRSSASAVTGDAARRGRRRRRPRPAAHRDEQGLVRVLHRPVRQRQVDAGPRPARPCSSSAATRTVTSLDGDVVRRNLSAGLTFSKEDRETNIRRIGWVAAEISRHGGIAICSPIAPFDATRQAGPARWSRRRAAAFVLVHVATPLEECERRDRKGLYAKARRGEIPEFTGISSPYEEPTDAAVRVDTTGRTIEDALDDVLRGPASRCGLAGPARDRHRRRSCDRPPHGQRPLASCWSSLRRRHRRRADRHGRWRPDDAGADLPRRRPDGRGRQRPGRGVGQQVGRRGRALAPRLSPTCDWRSG